jgi:hypothetical protein
MGRTIDDPVAVREGASRAEEADRLLTPDCDPGLSAMIHGYLAAVAATLDSPELLERTVIWLTDLEAFGDPSLLGEAWNRVAQWLTAAGRDEEASRYREAHRGGGGALPSSAPEFLEADDLCERGDDSGSIDLCCRGLAIEPGASGLLLVRARAYRHLGEEGRAALDIERALAHDPEEPSARLERARPIARDPAMFDCDVCRQALEDLEVASREPELAAHCHALAGTIHLLHFADREPAARQLDLARGHDPDADEVSALEDRLEAFDRG